MSRNTLKSQVRRRAQRIQHGRHSFDHRTETAHSRIDLQVHGMLDNPDS